MNSLLLILIVLSGYIIAYKTYGKYLGRKIFNIMSGNKMPSHTFKDGVDFVPTRKHIVFGHHFTTIAGLGPIVGPAIGIIWGWGPALIWIFFGSVFMGAVHDFSTLIISARNEGKSIGDLTGIFIGPLPKYAFHLIIQFLLFIVLAVFALTVSTLFILYPESVIPVWSQIPIAVFLGYLLNQGKNEILYSILALMLMYGSIIAGIAFPVDLSDLLHVNISRENETVLWCILLFIYVFIASTLPVHRLLQPRDYINSQQLFIAIILILAGIVIFHPQITAPVINSRAFSETSDVPGIFPAMFIIIACGAISGFHSIASTGTTVKQINNEKDTLPVGYGSMLTEGFLAVLVLMCIAAGLGLKESGAFQKYYSGFYESYSAASKGIGPKIQSFIIGAANFLEGIKINSKIGQPMIAVFIISFANTTLDSAARMQRLSFQEMIPVRKNSNINKLFRNRYVATFIVVICAAALTFMEPGGTGAMVLWPLFGALNQLLAALGLAIVSIFLFRNGKNVFIALLPMLFILIMTIWSIVTSIFGFINDNKYLLVVISSIILALTAFLLISCILTYINNRKNKIKI